MRRRIYIDREGYILIGHPVFFEGAIDSQSVDTLSDVVPEFGGGHDEVLVGGVGCECRGRGDDDKIDKHNYRG